MRSLYVIGNSYLMRGFSVSSLSAIATALFLLLVAHKPVAAQQSGLPYCVTGFTTSGSPITQPCSSLTPSPVTPGGNPTTGYTVQQVIQTTGTAIALPSQVAKAYELCWVQSVSGQSVSYGYSSAVTAPSATAFSGSAVGVYILAGGAFSDTVPNTNQIYINGNAGDGVQCQVH